jgi:hypothetical protein
MIPRAAFAKSPRVGTRGELAGKKFEIAFEESGVGFL